jgi:RNA polymerase sigma-70 factor, ECF subfamily
MSLFERASTIRNSAPALAIAMQSPMTNTLSVTMRGKLSHQASYLDATSPEKDRNWMTEADLDSLLVTRAQAGELRAFDLLVRRYQGKVIAAISKLVRDRTECEDIAQEVFIRVYKNLTGFRGESSFYTWIYRISINTAKNFLVSNGRRIATSDVEIDVADQIADIASLRDRATPEREVLSQEISRTVLDSMAALPVDIRQALHLREIDGLSYEEIAEKMNCPIGTVRSRIFRAREAIDRKVRPLMEQT